MLRYWTYLTTDCAICVQVCPWNRGNGVLDVLWKALAATRLRHAMLRLHKWQIDTKRSNKSWLRLSTVGRKLKPLGWWAGEESAVEEGRVRRQRRERGGGTGETERKKAKKAVPGDKRKTAVKRRSGDGPGTNQQRSASHTEGPEEVADKPR